MENFPIEELELGVRSYNCLKRVGIETIGDLVTKTENELASIPNFGKKSIEEVKETLAAARSPPPRRQRRRGRGLEPVRHQRSGKKLGRDSAHRKALYSNLAGALIEHGRIKTTVTKAKAVKPIAEQMITLGRRGDLHARRQATAFLRSRDVVHKLFAEVAPALRGAARAATAASSSSARAPATRPRWPTSSSSTTPLVFKTRLTPETVAAVTGSEVAADEADEAEETDDVVDGARAAEADDADVETAAEAELAEEEAAAEAADEEALDAEADADAEDGEPEPRK